MTYRSFIKSKIRRGLKILFPGLLLIFLGIYIFSDVLGDILGFIGLSLTTGAGIYLWKFVRCPKGKVYLDLLYIEKLNFCSTCGIDMETEYEH